MCVKSTVLNQVFKLRDRIELSGISNALLIRSFSFNTDHCIIQDMKCVNPEGRCTTQRSWTLIEQNLGPSLRFRPSQGSYDSWFLISVHLQHGEAMLMVLSNFSSPC